MSDDYQDYLRESEDIYKAEQKGYTRGLAEGYRRGVKDLRDALERRARVTWGTVHRKLSLTEIEQEAQRLLKEQE